ncbi:Arylacetamide deacetylase [Scheffersomyces coipomensis]|uniref:Arylacetamide deacetylase n=1 Tax=Scheffersomyces coipomensis TaxID=1788519 RepID=UPI00315CD075
MVTAGFISKVVTLPLTVVKTIFEYYTVGTIYQQTSPEFSDSLWKNVHVSALYHLSGNLHKSDVKTFSYVPLSNILSKYQNNHPLTQNLRNFGKPLDKYSYWIVENENAENVVVYVHGGGYLLAMFEGQLVAFTTLYYALTPEVRAKTSFLVIDYSLTLFDHIFPTQIWESLSTYKTLVENNYKHIHLVGDSAGVHLICALVRYLAYPQESHELFSQFPQFDFSSFTNLPQPKSLALLSPWIEPVTQPIIPTLHGVSILGDLGAKDTLMGEYYIEGLDRELINNFLTFSNTNFEDHWSKVEPIVNGNTIVVYGEREVLRDAIEKFHTIINKQNNIDLIMEKGGIHASFVYAECVDYIGPKGSELALEGHFENKFAYNVLSKFLNEQIE